MCVSLASFHLLIDRWCLPKTTNCSVITKLSEQSHILLLGSFYLKETIISLSTNISYHVVFSLHKFCFMTV